MMIHDRMLPATGLPRILGEPMARAATQTESAATPARDNRVDIWWARTEHFEPALIRVLDAVERSRAGRYRRREDRARFVLGAAVARIGAALRLGVPLLSVELDRRCLKCGRPHGKVVVASHPWLRMSVSHSGHWVGVAIHTGADVGLDVQVVDSASGPEDRRIARQALDTEELDSVYAVATGDRHRAIMTYWSRKEAAVKATGDGLAIPIREVLVSAPDSEPRLIRYPGRDELSDRMRMYRPEFPTDAVAALAVIRAEPVQVVEHLAERILRSAIALDHRTATRTRPPTDHRTADTKECSKP